MIDFEPKFVTIDWCGETHRVQHEEVGCACHEPTNPNLDNHEVKDLSGPPPLLGL